MTIFNEVPRSRKATVRLDTEKWQRRMFANVLALQYIVVLTQFIITPIALETYLTLQRIIQLSSFYYRMRRMGNWYRQFCM